MRVTGLLGGLFVSRLAVAVVPGVWLVLTVVCPLTRLTAVIAAVAVAPPAVLAPLAVCQALELIVVTSLKLVTILVASFHANLFVVELAERTVSHLHVKTALKIFHKSRERLVAELTPATEIFRVIAAVEAHIEPLNLQCSVGVWDVSLKEHLQDSQHLFKPMEMVQRQDKEILMDFEMATWTHIDLLVVARLLVVQGMLEEEFNRMFEAVSRGAIVLRQRCLWIGWFGEVILRNLLPVTQ